MRKVEPRSASGSGFLRDCRQTVGARLSFQGRKAVANEAIFEPALREDRYSVELGPARLRSSVAQVEIFPGAERRTPTGDRSFGVAGVFCCGASYRPLDKRRFQRSPGLSSSPKT